MVPLRSPTRSCQPTIVYLPAGTSGSVKLLSGSGPQKGMVQHHDRRAHVRMDVAKDLDQAGLRELLLTRLALPVSSEIEGPRPRQRKHVMEVGIVVRERHDRSPRDDGHARREGLVPLFDLAARRRQDTLEGGTFR